VGNQGGSISIYSIDASGMLTAAGTLETGDDPTAIVMIN
jgi:hypothetical protein